MWETQFLKHSKTSALDFEYAMFKVSKRNLFKDVHIWNGPAGVMFQTWIFRNRSF